MNTFQSLRLIRELYFKKGLPDLDLIQSYGLLAVKIGQIHALRLDFLPAETCEHLSKLYRAASPIPAEDIDALLLAHGGPTFRDHFSDIGTDPIAIASVGQVYRATLRDGSPVAVKVIKKDFKDRFARDVRRLRRFFRLTIALYPKLRGVGDPLGILGDIEEYTTAELDLRNEARGQAVLRDTADRHRDTFDLSMLGFPEMYPDLSGENVLVSSFIEAPTVDELLSSGAFPYEDMLKLFYLQGFFMFIAGKFHGDFHPGNILYDGKRFFLVDTAFVGEVGDRIRRGLFFFFEALARADYPTCAKQLNEMAENRIEGEAFDTFERAFLDLYRDFKGKTVSEVSLTRQMMLTIKLGVNSGMVFEKGIFAIIRSLMYLDGMVLKCNPQAVLMDDMRSFVDRFRQAV
jgi:ubiquinone biosynthesis protein